VGAVAPANLMPENNQPPGPLPPSGKWTGDALHEHFTTRHRDIEVSVQSRLDDLQAQIDRRIDTQARERADTEKHLSELVEGLRREVGVVNRETQRAVTEANQEREKAAQALAETTRQSITEGDDRLREHIENQVNQIEAALESARRETQFAHEASQKAIEKAEAATEKRFDQVNAFREELSDRWAQTLPREVADAQFAEFAKRLDKTERDLDKRVGAEMATDRRKASVQPWALWIAGAALAVLIVLVNVLVSLGGPP
jgi:DNA repair exonuclease SbcCD ATPase subunit